MSTLITGAAGFVGANLLSRLVSTGHNNIHILIRPHTDTWRINRILNNVTVHTGDISDALSVNKLVTSIKPRVIFHLAATTSGAHPRYEDSPEQLFSVNATGTLNLLTACASNQPCLFINTGSSSEYGKKSTPMRESMDPNPCTPYGISKMMSTLLCRQYARMCRMPTMTLRLFSPYGPLEDSHRFIPTAIAAFAKNQSPRFLSTPSCVRDYVYIDDVIDAYIAAPDKATFAGDSINIGSGKEYTLGTVVNNIRKLCRSTQEPLWNATNQADWEPTHWSADIHKAKELLGWEPKYSLEEGLKKCIEYYQGLVN